MRISDLLAGCWDQYAGHMNWPPCMVTYDSTGGVPIVCASWLRGPVAFQSNMQSFSAELVWGYKTKM